MWWPWGKESKKVQQNKLSGLVRGLMHAVQRASDMAGQQHFDLLDNYFDKAEDGTLIPRVVRVQTAPGKVMEVPTIALLNPGSFTMASLEVEMHVKLVANEVKDAVAHGVEQARGQRVSYGVEMGHKQSKDAVNLRVTFKADDHIPEAFTRLVEELQNGIMRVGDQ